MSTLEAEEEGMGALEHASSISQEATVSLRKATQHFSATVSSLIQTLKHVEVKRRRELVPLSILQKFREECASERRNQLSQLKSLYDIQFSNFQEDVESLAMQKRRMSEEVRKEVTDRVLQLRNEVADEVLEEDVKHTEKADILRSVEETYTHIKEYELPDEKSREKDLTETLEKAKESIEEMKQRKAHMGDEIQKTKTELGGIQREIEERKRMRQEKAEEPRQLLLCDGEGKEGLLKHIALLERNLKDHLPETEDEIVSMLQRELEWELHEFRKRKRQRGLGGVASQWSRKEGVNSGAMFCTLLRQLASSSSLGTTLSRLGQRLVSDGQVDLRSMVLDTGFSQDILRQGADELVSLGIVEESGDGVLSLRNLEE